MKLPSSSGNTISYILVAAIFSAVGALATHFYFKHKSPGNLKEVLELIDRNYVDSVDTQSLQRNIIPLLLEQLDPHSVYLNKLDNEEETVALSGEFCGIGVTFNMLLDTIVVTQVAPGGPSERAGIRPGDRLLRAGTQILYGKGVDFEKVSDAFRGEKGSVVNILARRNGRELQYRVVRDDVALPSLSAYFILAPAVAYMRIDTWSSTTHAEFLEAFGRLRKKGATSLILDLRGNRGGLLEPAIAMANEFLGKNLPIVQIEGKAYPREEISSDGKGILQKVPLVVLVDELSASSSEVFTGAMQDHDRAQIIGRRTFGKGLVQMPFDLADGSAIRLTVARYYTPSGRSIQKPYSSGVDVAYYQDLKNRFNHGELYSADSIPLPGGKTFKTDKGRLVYGGGGIVPDIFIPLDTVGLNSYMIRVEDADLIQHYAFLYSDANRDYLSRFKTVEELADHLDRTYLIFDFASFAQKQGVPMRTSLINEARDRIKRQINAAIAMNFFDLQGYYQLMLRDDSFILKAISLIKEGKTIPSVNGKKGA